MLAVVCAIAAYWVIRIITPPPSSAPPPIAAQPPRDPDPALSARLFGLVQTTRAVVVSNIQVVGVFAAGEDSAAILTVDGKGPRAYVIGQEIVPGTTLTEVRADAVVIETAAGRQTLQVPPPPDLQVASAAPPPPAYTRQGNTLSAPSGAAPAAPAAPPRAFTPPRQFVPPQPMPQLMPVSPQTPVDEPVQPADGGPQSAPPQQ
jgi:general secretion pathway protein C